MENDYSPGQENNQGRETESERLEPRHPLPPRTPTVLEALFDLSFSTFITAKIVKVLFVLSVVLAAISALFLLAGGFRGGFGTAVLALIAAPLLFVFYVIMARVACELIMVVFNIAENTSRLVEQGEERAREADDEGV